MAFVFFLLIFRSLRLCVRLFCLPSFVVPAGGGGAIPVWSECLEKLLDSAQELKCWYCVIGSDYLRLEFGVERQDGCTD